MRSLKAITLIFIISAINMLSSCNDDGPETELITCDSNTFQKQDFHVDLSESVQFQAQNYPQISCYDYTKRYTSNGFGIGCGGVEREYYYFREEMTLEDDRLGSITLRFYKAFWVDEIDFNEPDWRVKSLFKGEVKFFHKKILLDDPSCYQNDDNLLEVLLSDGLPTVVELSLYDKNHQIFTSADIAQDADARFTVDEFELVDFEGVMPSQGVNKLYGFNGIVSGKVSCKLVDGGLCYSPSRQKDIIDVSFRLPVDVGHVQRLPTWCD